MVSQLSVDVGRVEPRVRRLVDREHARRSPRSAPGASQERPPRGRYCAPAPPASAAPPATAAEEIRLEGVSKVYADGTVGVAELDLTFAAGELTVLVGPVRAAARRRR